MSKYFKITALFMLITVFISCDLFKNILDGDNGNDADSIIVQGDITQNTTWTLAGSPYIVTNTVTVTEGVKLTIEPGVIVKFDYATKLIVNGSLDAQGTENNKIIFTENVEHTGVGNWCGVEFTDSCTDSNCIIRYCVIEYCDPGCLKIHDCSPTIAHNIMRHIYSRAECGCTVIGCRGEVLSKIECNVFSDFEGAALFCHFPANPKLIENDIMAVEGWNGTSYTIVGGGFLDGNYLECGGVVDTTLGNPVDEIGDGICNTTSVAPAPQFRGVDGVTNPKSTPNY
ncbi:MAG TPA: hypothetical protein ENN20_02690 [Candidatus Marinimicrobia bacterium]|nr:hypothetical protein [Candidatus Neomarinimicrobiota bacterium]